MIPLVEKQNLRRELHHSCGALLVGQHLPRPDPTQLNAQRWLSFYFSKSYAHNNHLFKLSHIRLCYVGHHAAQAMTQE